MSNFGTLAQSPLVAALPLPPALAPNPIGSIPTPTLGDLQVESLVIGSVAVMADITQAIEAITADRTINGASTITVQLLDTARTLLRSGIFRDATGCVLDSLTFTLAQISKGGDILTLVFEDTAVATLRRLTGQRTAAAGTTTRTQFAQRLIVEAAGPTIRFNGFNDASLTQEPLARGTSSNPAEDTWSCLQRLASEVQWRCFCVAGTVWFGPDSWLMQQAPLGALHENSSGVDMIDFDWDSGKPVATASVHAVASRWSFPPGSIITLANMGVADGNWIVSDINRSLYSHDANITLTQPQPSLPEPAAASSTAATSAALGFQSTAGATAAAQAVAYAQSQLGVPYQWGGDNPATGFDCSGLVQAAYQTGGITLPRVAQDQFNAGPQVTGQLIPGDLVFFGTSSTNVTHVGIYIGGGQMIDAPHPGAVVRTEAIPNQIGGSWGSDIFVGATRPAQ